MAYRDLTKAQWRAETYLAISDLWFVLGAWIGIALSIKPLIYFAVFLFVLKLPAMFVRGDTKSSGGINEWMVNGLAFLAFQFCTGVLVYAFLNWDDVLELGLSLVEGQIPLASLFHSEVILSAAVYGLYGVLSVRTALVAFLTVPGATQQVLLYETGRESPEQWS